MALGRAGWMFVAALALSCCGSPEMDAATAPDAAFNGGTDASPSLLLTTVDIEVILDQGLLQRRSHAAIASDPRTQRIFLSGGFDQDNEVLGDVLEWSNSGWQTVASSLYPEGNHGLVYLPAYEKFGVFGNNEDVGWWLWDPNTGASSDLQTICNLGCPLGRSGHSMAYMPDRDAAVLVSGVGGAANSIAPVLRRDSYLLEGTDPQWRTPAGTTPPARRDAAVAYDPGRNAVFLFGGYGEDDFTPLNDLWRLDASGWQQIQDSQFQSAEDMGSADRPAGRSGATLTYHPGIDKLVLIGGLNPMSPFEHSKSLGYWTWDGESWQRLENGRNADLDHPESTYLTWDYEHASIYDPELDAILVVGGAGKTGQTRLLRIVETQP